jgi:hypothetical protein
VTAAHKPSALAPWLALAVAVPLTAVVSIALDRRLAHPSSDHDEHAEHAEEAGHAEHAEEAGTR